MTKTTPGEGKNLRLCRVDSQIGELADGFGLVAEHVHVKGAPVKGAPVKLANGKIRASKAARHYVSLKNADRAGPDDANERICEILTALRRSRLAHLINSGSVEAEIDLAAFHGEIAWEDEIDGNLLAAARAARERVVVKHYDRFTDEGAPLAVRL